MNWCSEFADRIERDAPLGRLTWFRLGGPVSYLFHPKDARELARMVVRARDNETPLKVLGAGANVLISDDGFDGVVVRLDAPCFKGVSWQEDGLQVGAGVDLMPLSRSCSELGLSGLECMAGIPGSIGGAIRMNAGGRFGELGAIVQEVEVLCEDGCLETWTHDRLAFGYRSSMIQNEIVLQARLSLHEEDRAVVSRRFDEFFDYKKRSQPLADRSAGCIFKNPEGQSAGALIDRAGLKGHRCGQARVSEHHANFIVTGPDATASDVMQLIEVVRDRVQTVHGTELEVEVDIW